MHFRTAAISAVPGHDQIVKQPFDKRGRPVKVLNVRPVIHMQTARIGQAISSPVRLRALNLLAQRSWTVSELAQELGETLAATSAHLKVLRAACLITEEKLGRELWCKVESEEVLRLLVAAQQAAEALLPDLRELIQQAQNDPYLLPRFSLHDLKDDLAAGRITLIDLRPESEFKAGHLPTARSLPYPTLEQADLKSLRRAKNIVAYCRGPWCAMARAGVAALNERNVPAKRLFAGIAEWRVEGLPLERTE